IIIKRKPRPVVLVNTGTFQSVQVSIVMRIAAVHIQVGTEVKRFYLKSVTGISIQVIVTIHIDILVGALAEVVQVLALTDGILAEIQTKTGPKVALLQ